MIPAVLLKYVKGLADVALELGVEDEVDRHLQVFGGLLDSHDELAETLANPAIPFSARRAMVSELARIIPLHDIVVNFILILLEQARINQLPEAAQVFQEILDERRGVARGHVLSCSELGQETRVRLEGLAATLTGQDVKLEFELDKSLLGGMRLQIGSTVYDGSLSTQLEEIRRRFSG